MTDSLEKLNQLDGLVDRFIVEYGKSEDEKAGLSNNITEFVKSLSGIGVTDITKWKEKRRREGITPLFDDLVELQGLIKKRITEVLDENRATEMKINLMYDQLLTVVGTSEVEKPKSSLPAAEPVSLLSANPKSIPALIVPNAQPDSFPVVVPTTELGSLDVQVPSTGDKKTDPKVVQDIDEVLQQFEKNKAEQARQFKEGTGGRKTLRKRFGKKKRKSYKLANRKHSAASSSL